MPILSFLDDLFKKHDLRKYTEQANFKLGVQYPFKWLPTPVLNVKHAEQQKDLL